MRRSIAFAIAALAVLLVTLTTRHYLQRHQPTAEFLIFGDVRPSCDQPYDLVPLTPLMLAQMGSADYHPAVVLGTGDYLCAWPDEPQEARRQFWRFQKLYPRHLIPRTLLAHGNHEKGHTDTLIASRFTATPYGWQDSAGIRVVWLPSDTDWQNRVTPDWLQSALSFTGPLIVIRHEPWGSCGTRGDEWIRDQVRARRPRLIAFGHIHTVALPGTTLQDCGRSVTLAGNEVIIGNGGADGWEKSAGYVGFARGWLNSDGSISLQLIDHTGTVRKSVLISR